MDEPNCGPDQKIPDVTVLLLKIRKEHDDRARTLSELYHKMLAKAKKTMKASEFEQFLKAMDICKRVAEHVGACQAMNEFDVAYYNVPQDHASGEPAAG